MTIKNTMKDLNRQFDKMRYSFTDNQLELLENLAEKLIYDINLAKVERETQQKLKTIKNSAEIAGGINLCLTCEYWKSIEDDSGIFDECLKDCLPIRISACGVVLCNHYKDFRKEIYPKLTEDEILEEVAYRRCGYRIKST